MTDYAKFTRDDLIAEIEVLKQTIETRTKKMAKENNQINGRKYKPCWQYKDAKLVF